LKNAVNDTYQSSHSDHQGWGRWDTRAQGEMARQHVARLAQRARDRSGRHYHQLDKPLQTVVDALIKELEPTIDWRRVLAMFSNSSCRSRMHNTLRRPSKRYGTYPGMKARRAHRVAVAVDTSGSISDHDLSEFFAEIKGIWRQGSEITIVEADQVVQHVWQYRGGGPPQKVSGRQGTSFEPVMRWAVDQTNAFDALIYLTDGFAAEPVTRPRCPVLWVLVADGDSSRLRFGRVARITSSTQGNSGGVES